jgi:ABC-type multidrug transport system ATPase subunit
MKITLTDTGKRFNRDWIFRHLDYEFLTGTSYAITGPNGSGKSTLLRVIAGATAQSEGKLQYFPGETIKNSEPLADDSQYRYLSFSAPYLELIEEMTLLELISFHRSFKSFVGSVTTEEMISLLGLRDAAAKQIRYFSSGMKQRVKLGLAIFADTPVLLLDEPCTNLDAEGISLYRHLVLSRCQNRLLIVSSNDPQEYDFCKGRMNMSAYK